jgi:hypothetical protein
MNLIFYLHFHVQETETQQSQRHFSKPRGNWDLNSNLGSVACFCSPTCSGGCSRRIVWAQSSRSAWTKRVRFPSEENKTKRKDLNSTVIGLQWTQTSNNSLTYGFHFFVYTPRVGLLDHTLVHFCFLRIPRTVFHNGCTNLHSQKCAKTPFPPHRRQLLLSSVFLITVILTRVRWYPTVVLIAFLWWLVMASIFPYTH